MSLRVCAKCDFVIDNRIHNEEDCPRCKSTDMLCPNDDDRDWGELHLKQLDEMWENAAKLTKCENGKELKDFFNKQIKEEKDWRRNED